METKTLNTGQITEAEFRRLARLCFECGLSHITTKENLCLECKQQKENAKMERRWRRWGIAA
jgi:hypothetical protein